MSSTEAAEGLIRSLLEQWATATRQGRLDDILANHLSDVLIFDVLAPLNYEGAEEYRKSWGDWHPDTQGEGQFGLEQLSITAGTEIAFAHAFIRCGGTLPDGSSFEDLVRATFCLKLLNGSWKIAHQHISKPMQLNSD